MTTRALPHPPTRRRQLYSIDSVRGILKLIVFHDSLLADIEVGKKTLKVGMEKDFHRVSVVFVHKDETKCPSWTCPEESLFPSVFLYWCALQIKSRFLWRTFYISPFRLPLLQKSVFHSFFTFPVSPFLPFRPLLTITNFSISGKNGIDSHKKKKKPKEEIISDKNSFSR